MPRQNRRSPAAPLRQIGGGAQHSDSFRGEEVTVRAVTGAGATKTYRCPGCDQEIRPGVPHVVVWPAYDLGADDRRHWHRPCWDARDRRAPAVRRRG